MDGHENPAAASPRRPKGPTLPEETDASIFLSIVSQAMNLIMSRLSGSGTRRLRLPGKTFPVTQWDRPRLYSCGTARGFHPFSSHPRRISRRALMTQYGISAATPEISGKASQNCDFFLLSLKTWTLSRRISSFFQENMYFPAGCPLFWSRFTKNRPRNRWKKAGKENIAAAARWSSGAIQWPFPAIFPGAGRGFLPSSLFLQLNILVSDSYCLQLNEPVIKSSEIQKTITDFPMYHKERRS